MAFNQQKAIEDYNELMRRVSVGAYSERSAEDHLNGTWPSDGVEESIYNLTELASKYDLEFVWHEPIKSWLLVPMSEETKAARLLAQESMQAERRAQEQAMLDIPYVEVGESRLYQYHDSSKRWYIEVDLQHHDPDQGAAIVLYRVWKTTDGSMAAMKVDIREVQSEEEYQDTQHYMEHHYLGGE
jgi:hypothetical protein